MERIPLILVDGSSYLFRAYHALPPLTNSKGKPTGAIYGVLNMLRKLLKDYTPEKVAVVFDSKEKTIRHTLFPNYKANRTAMPDELREQIAPLFTAIKALGFPLIIEAGVEADDVIGTLAKHMSERGEHVLISTGDKDIAQLVNDQITLVNTMTDKILDREGVIEKFGVAPEQIVDYLMLVGDTSDNIPGVPKVGPKTAAKWIQEYGSINALIEQAHDIKGKVGENLRSHIETLSLSRKLVTIDCEIPLTASFDDLTLQPQDKKTLIELFTELEFNKWLADIQSEEKISAEKISEQRNQYYVVVSSEEEFEKWLRKLENTDCFSFEMEINNIANPMEAECVGFAFSSVPNEAIYIPVGHNYEDAPKQLDRAWVLEKIKPLFENPNNTIIGSNLKNDYKVLANAGITMKAMLRDVVLESYVIDGGVARQDLEVLVLKYLGKNSLSYASIAGSGVKQKSANDIPIEIMSQYACEKADLNLQLHACFESIYQKELYFGKILKDIEWPMLSVLARMELHGVLIDEDMLNKQSAELQLNIDKLKNTIYELAGEEFNIDSPKQLREILFHKLNIPMLKKTPTGEASTAEEVLQELSHDYPIPQLILEHRSCSKLKSTYTDKLPKQINEKTGRIHTNYIQTGTSTGRLASKDPNLQNIPIRTEAGRQIRQAFIAEKNYQLIAADYSQVELRIMAHFSKDPGLLTAFERGLDVHAATAAEVFGVSLDAVTSDQRRSAKAINFGLLYGMSAFGLAKQLRISRQEAEKYVNTYFARYPRVFDYIENARKQAVKQGYVETLFGRRLAIPEIHSKDPMRRKAAERAAINAPLQGTAADIIKIAMISIDDWIQKNNLDNKIKMLMQVHDELIFEVNNSIVDDAMNEIKRRMEGAANLAVPLLVEIGVGKNWDEA